MNDAPEQNDYDLDPSDLEGAYCTTDRELKETLSKAEPIRISLGDGELSTCKQTEPWVESFSCYISQLVGMNPTIRIGVYWNGFAKFFAMDLWSKDSASSMCITIGISNNEIVLPTNFDDQMDLILPGIIDIFWILSKVSELTEARISVTTQL